VLFPVDFHFVNVNSYFIISKNHKSYGKSELSTTFRVSFFSTTFIHNIFHSLKYLVSYACRKTCKSSCKVPFIAVLL
jgi:hypothetical protein